MRKLVAGAALAMTILALGACGRSGNSNELTAEDNAQLDEANNMLDTSPDSLAVGNVTLGNGENASSDSIEAGDEAIENGVGDDTGNDE
jgi:predicted small lipoprotein YifL